MIGLLAAGPSLLSGATSGNKNNIKKEKLLETKSSGGGALVKSGETGKNIKSSSALVKYKAPSVEKITPQKSNAGGELNGIIGVIGQIRSNLSQVRGFIAARKNANLKGLVEHKKFIKLGKAKKREKELETKKPIKGIGSKIKSIPGPGFSIGNFFSMVLLGSVLNFLLRHRKTIFKMFDDLGKGLTNIWTALKSGITSLIDNFPKAIEDLDKFGKKLFDSNPVKNLGNIFKELGTSFQNMLSKLGGFGTSFLGNLFSGNKDKIKKEKPQTKHSDRLSPGKWGPILDLIGSVEGTYESVYPSSKIPGLTEMTIREAFNARENWRAKHGGTGAFGRYQLVSDPIGRAKAAGLNPEKDLFSPENQDKIAITIITSPRYRGIDLDMLTNDPAKAQLLLAQEWAGLPKDSSNISYYAGVGDNAARTTTAKVREAFKQVIGSSSPSPTNLENLQDEKVVKQTNNKIDPFKVLEMNKKLVPFGMYNMVLGEIKKDPSKYDTKEKIETALNKFGIDPNDITYPVVQATQDNSNVKIGRDDPFAPVSSSSPSAATVASTPSTASGTSASVSQQTSYGTGIGKRTVFYPSGNTQTMGGAQSMSVGGVIPVMPDAKEALNRYHALQILEFLYKNG